MNILILNYEYPPLGGGGASVTKELCEKLVKYGHCVDVITMGFEKLPRIEKHGNLTVHRVKCWRTKQRVCHPWEQLSYCLKAYSYIKKKINIRDYDFIHCHFIIPTGLLALWLKRKYGIRYLITSHGSDVIGHNNARFSVLYKLITPGWKKILAYADIITAPSVDLINKIHKTAPNVEVILIPNGINVSEYKPAIKRKSIITMTRLQESKGVQDLIRACSQIDMKSWEINILGDGPYRPELEKLVAEKGMENVVHFRGHVVGEKKIQYLSEAGCFFSGSRFEAFDISVLESSLCGCNIVASNIEPHVLLAGKGHIYEDEDALKKMLRDIVSEEPKVIDYNNEKYDWENVYKMYEEQYRKM